MSDERVRELERAYRASGSAEDGEAWVQEVMRTTGAPLAFLVRRTIEAQRALTGFLDPRNPGELVSLVRARGELARPVTPDDMVSFLRGGSEWLERPAQITSVVSPPVILPRPQDPRDRRTPLCEHEIYRTCRRCSPSVLDSPVFCEHAKECPSICPCTPNCYCRQPGSMCANRPTVDGVS